MLELLHNQYIAIQRISKKLVVSYLSSQNFAETEKELKMMERPLSKVRNTLFGGSNNSFWAIEKIAEFLDCVLTFDKEMCPVTWVCWLRSVVVTNVQGRELQYIKRMPSFITAFSDHATEHADEARRIMCSWYILIQYDN